MHEIEKTSDGNKTKWVVNFCKNPFDVEGKRNLKKVFETTKEEELDAFIEGLGKKKRK